MDTIKTKVCVIGAGWFGIVAAKTYFQIDPSIDLTILEASDSIGGTWSRRRTYPTLLAQQPYGIYEYADLPMDTTGIADPENTFIPSPKLHEYMNDYAAKFGIADKVRFNSRVSKIERRTGGGGWDIWLQDTDEPLGFDKVIVATGLTSNPNIPNLETVDFTPPTFHTMELGERLEWIRRDEVETVTVYGGGKSAVDAVYTCAKMGKRVDWVIRPDGVGNGVPCLIPPTVLGQSGSAVGSSRFGQMQHPCLDTRGDWWYRFLHSGKGLGYWLHWKWLGYLSSVMLQYAGYDKSENMAKLKPIVQDHAGFWNSLPTSLVNQPEVLDFIHAGEKVKVFRETITSLSDDSVVLSSGEKCRTDAVIFATGYNISEPIYSPELAGELGVSIDVQSYPPHLAEKWDNLESAADIEVLESFPRLKEAPACNQKPVPYTPYRLYQTILPPALAEKEDRSLVFVGPVGPLNTALVSEVVALWAAAWLSGNLKLEVTQAEMEWDIALRNAFMRRRYTVAGSISPYHLFEYLPMVDGMLRQLGVKTRRKDGVFADLFEPYCARDYRGMVEEWKNNHR